jgi:hypothetical protein
MRAFARIDNQKAGWMLDQPAGDRQPRAPITVGQDVKHACRARHEARVKLMLLDLDEARLDWFDAHRVL